VKPGVEIFTSAAYRNGRAGVGVVLRAGGQTTQVIRRAVRAGSPAEATYRALLVGLWHARRGGARQARVHADHLEVVAQLNGDQDLPAEFTGVYLQVRALMNAYRKCELDYLRRDANAEAALTAVEALDDEPVLGDEEYDVGETLPLFGRPS
jgi:ribonuclease HI